MAGNEVASRQYPPHHDRHERPTSFVLLQQRISQTLHPSSSVCSLAWHSVALSGLFRGCSSYSWSSVVCREMLVVSCMHASWPSDTALQVIVSRWSMSCSMSKSIRCQRESERKQGHFPFIQLYQSHYLLLHFRIVAARHCGILQWCYINSNRMRWLKENEVHALTLETEPFPSFPAHLAYQTSDLR